MHDDRDDPESIMLPGPKAPIDWPAVRASPPVCISSEAVLIAVLVAAALGLLWLLIVAAQREAEECRLLGGHQISKPTVGVGFSGSDDIAVTSGSVTFCVSEDGRILQ